MKSPLRRVALFALAGAAAVLLAPWSPSQHTPAKLRVGTYDNRAIAIAYTSSKYNDVGELVREHRAAEQAGEKRRAKELEERGQARQRKLHRQGFGRVPVDDLLAHVAGRFPEVAREAGVDAIAWTCDWTGPDVEVVDVTDALARLFDPSEKALGWIADIKKQPFVDLDELAKAHDH